MSQELLPCPFCGSTPSLREVPSGGGSYEWTVRCTRGQCMRPETHEYEAPHQAIAAWNTRPTAQAVAVDDAFLNEVALFLSELPQDLGKGSLNGLRAQLASKIMERVNAALQAAMGGV